MNLRSSRNPTYVTWRSLVGRCTNPRFDNYSRYGGAGVTIDERWLNFDNFVEDMGCRPDGMTLDRIDSTKGYTKDNCKWSTPSEQQSNRKCNMYLTYNGVTKTAREWARDLGLAPGAVWNRIKLLKWSVEKAVTTRKVG